MPRLGTFKPQTLPLVAIMDNRSNADEVDLGHNRLVKNMAALGDRGAARMPGWLRFGSCNSDLHDQLVPLVQGYDSFTYTSDPTYTENGYTYANYYAAYTYVEYDPMGGATTLYYDWTGDFTYLYDIAPGYNYEVCGPDLAYRPYCPTNFSASGAREAITLMQEFGSGDGVRKLVAATESRIYTLNEQSNNWRILADGLSGGGTCGCGRRRFHSASLGNYLLFTNNYDDVLAWNFDDPASGCDLQAARPIDDLVTLGVRKSSVVVEYKGFIFLMNVEVEGVRYVAKAIWSDYGNPISYAPSNESLAGDSDIGDPGEAIIEAKALGDYLLIYKERSIWRATLVDQDSGLFNFTQVYKGERALRYRNTLTSTGTAHYYFGVDDIYQVDLFRQNPEPIGWITQATRMIFDKNLVFSSENLASGISESDCDLAVGGYDAVQQTLWFSWVAYRNADGTSASETTGVSFTPRHSVACPNRTLTVGLKYQSSSYVDHGFSAFTNFRPDDRMTLRDWLLAEGACLESEVMPETKEGTLCYDASRELSPGGSYPTPGVFGVSSVHVTGLTVGQAYVLVGGANDLFFQFDPVGDEIVVNVLPGIVVATSTGFTATGHAGTLVTFSLKESREGVAVTSILNATEDPDLPIDPDSLCSALGDRTFEDFCEACGADTRFLMASAADLCIKQYDMDTYSREHFDFSTQLYSQIGYTSVLESAAMSFGIDAEKYLNHQMIEFAPPVQSPTPNLYLNLGYSSQPECAKWAELTPQPLKCQTAAAGDATIRPYDKAYFNRLMRGRYLFYRIFLTGTTGPTSFSKTELYVRKAER